MGAENLVTANPVGAAVQGGIGLVEDVIGFINAGKAKREAELLAKQRPNYNISPESQNELSLAESELSTGMSGEAKNAYEQGLDRDLSTSLSAILQGGGSVNNIGSLYDNSQQGRAKLATMKENIRLNQINNLVSARRNMTDQQDKAFMYNVDAPWKDRVQANAAARQNAQSLINAGLNTVGSAAIGYSNSVDNANSLNNYFKTPQTTKTSRFTNGEVAPIVNPAPIVGTNIDLSTKKPFDFGTNNDYSTYLTDITHGE